MRQQRFHFQPAVKKAGWRKPVSYTHLILTITDEVQPVAGNDIWLTLDLNLQKAIYNILERQLAGVLLKTIVNKEADEIVYTDSSNIKLPIKDAYFQLINNNVLSLEQFASVSYTHLDVYKRQG